MVEDEVCGQGEIEAPETDPLDNRMFVLVLQHPRERKEALATAAATCAMLDRATLVVGLSWPNLGRALGHAADASRWAVLYLGSARPAAFGSEREVLALGRDGMPVIDQEGALDDLEGVVLLDGSWSEAKTLWWRNPWLLKLRRIVLNPRSRSRFGQLRREPRAAALSTIEAVAVLMKHLEGSGGIEAALLDRLARLIADARTARTPRLRSPRQPPHAQIRHG